MPREVHATPDFFRIRDLPFRTAEDHAEELTQLLRTPTGTQKLRPIQAQALMEAAQNGGAFCPIVVGGGKTLVTLLLPTLLGVQHAVLFLPANLIEKTKRAIAEASKDWKIRPPQLFSYEKMGRVASAKQLDFWKPQLLIFDECHRIKNRRAAVTRRIARFLRENPSTKVVSLSGTIMRASIRDFSHIIGWSLKNSSPLPLEEHVVMMWADAVDEDVGMFSRMEPGVLMSLPGPEHPDPVTCVRQKLHHRIVNTSGVVATDTDDVAASLYITGVQHPVNEITEKNFVKLRGEYKTPSGWELAMAMHIWRVARQLAIGLHYEWDEPPPPEWLERRSDWAKFVREILAHSHTVDSELQVANACDEGKYDATYLNRWREIKPTYTIRPKPVWHDDSALEFCTKWGKETPSLIWCEHVFFARELSKRTGWAYYGENGLTDDGLYVEDNVGEHTIILSTNANKIGRNLQHVWNRNLFTTMIPGALDIEQTIGRTHRSGQKKDEVIVDVLMTCAEAYSTWEKNVGEAMMAEELLGQKQKILMADVDMPVLGGMGPRWLK